MMELRTAIFNALGDFRGSPDERESFIINRTIELLRESNQLPPEMSAESTEEDDSVVSINDTPEKKASSDVVIDDTPEKKAIDTPLGDKKISAELVEVAEAKRTSSKRGPGTAGLGDNPRGRFVSMSPQPPTEAAPAAAALPPPPPETLPPPALLPPPPPLPPPTLPPVLPSVATSTAVTTTQQVRLTFHCYFIILILHLPN